MKICNKIKIGRKKLKMTQGQFGKLVGVCGVTVHRWEKGVRKPSVEEIKTIAQIFKVDISSLVYDRETNFDNEIKTIENFDQKKIAHADKTDIVNYYLPLLGMDEIDSWLKFPILKQSHVLLKMTILEENIQNNAFAYTVNGSSMVHPSDSSQSLLPGEIAIIDPGLKDKVDPGNLVFVKFDSGDYRIRQYQKDGKSVFLKAFDSDIAPVFIDENIKIIGVIISTYRNKR